MRKMGVRPHSSCSGTPWSQGHPGLRWGMCNQPEGWDPQDPRALKPGWWGGGGEGGHRKGAPSSASQFLHPQTGEHTQLGSPGFWSGSPVVGEEANLGTGLGTDPEFSPEPALSFQPVRMGLIALGVSRPGV